MTTTSEKLVSTPRDTAHDVRNPANGQVVGRVNWTDPSDIPGIVAQLAKAQPSWERLGPEGRGQVLARFAQWLIDNTGRIEAQLIAETGKSKIDGGIEIPSILAIIAYYAPKAAEFLAPESRAGSGADVSPHSRREQHRVADLAFGAMPRRADLCHDWRRAGVDGPRLGAAIRVGSTRRLQRIRTYRR
ncbi:Putative aldehyde dehydrogenase [Mycobacteroides abscessus]|nr:Putative aldehyde dehydrogenase [Mycobacteroides abscessus]